MSQHALQVHPPLVAPAAERADRGGPSLVSTVTARIPGSWLMARASSSVIGGLRSQVHDPSLPSQFSKTIGKRFTEKLFGPAASNAFATLALIP